jgi:CRISPR-associated protein Csb2
MKSRRFFRLTIQFHDSVHWFHGRGEGGSIEWPPSPLRIYQALVDAIASRSQTGVLTENEELLRLLAGMQPVIIADAGVACTPFRLAVPNNDLDAWATPMSKGVKPKKQPAELKSMKAVQPVGAIGIEGARRPQVVYLYQIDEHVENSLAQLAEEFRVAARSITHVGWGIDMVAADADVITAVEAAALSGERWVAAASGGVALRTPTAGTLDDLIRKHQEFLNRLTDEGFRPVPPLREFAITQYRRAGDPEPRPNCVFHILKPDASGNLAFNTARRTRSVAAWIRHAVAEVCEPAGWHDFLPFVHGHNADGSTPNSSGNSSQRFQYLPLPTINSKLQRVESIRRVMVAAPAGFEDRIDFIRRRLLGHELRWDNHTVGLLNLQTGRDWVRDQYIRQSKTWSTVTPVVLDGFNDHNARKTEKLLTKALANAGIMVPVEFEHSPFGFRAGVDPVRDFLRPEKLTGSLVHVRLRFAEPFSGPLAIGAGRYRGFGLFAAEDA